MYDRREQCIQHNDDVDTNGNIHFLKLILGFGCDYEDTSTVNLGACVVFKGIVRKSENWMYEPGADASTVDKKKRGVEIS